MDTHAVAVVASNAGKHFLRPVHTKNDNYNDNNKDIVVQKCYNAIMYSAVLQL